MKVILVLFLSLVCSLEDTVNCAKTIQCDSLTVDTLSLDSGNIETGERNKVLDEVIIDGKYLEKEILFKGQDLSTFKTIWASDDPQSYLHTFQNIDATDGELGKYAGNWQWKSADGDTILTIKLVDARISYIRTIDPKTISQETMFLGTEFSSQHSFLSRKSYAPKTIRCYRNHLFAKFEYQIGDSVLFSNLHSKIKFNSNFFRKRHKSKEERSVLIGLPYQAVSNHTVWLYWPYNPLEKNLAVVTFSFLDEKNDIALWRMDAIKEVKSDRFVVRKALKDDFVLPVSVVLHRIDKVVRGN